MTERLIQVICVDDQSDLTSLLQTWINVQSDMRCPRTFHTADSLVDFLIINPNERPDVILLDWAMPGMPASDAIEFIIRIRLRTHVVVYSAHTREGIEPIAMRAGARGFVSKTAEIDLVLDAIRSASKGEYVNA